MTKRTPLTTDEKIALQFLKKQNTSVRKAAKTIGRPKSTVGDYYKLLDENQSMNHGQGPKILLWDIETAPMIGYHWGRWKQNIASSQVIQESYMLTWSAKWLGSDEVMVDSVHYHHEVTGVPCDKEIVTSLWELLNEADLFIYQNGDHFDLKRFNTRAIVHGLPPIMPSKTIDTLKIAKRYFGFSSNRLDDLALALGLPIRKIKTEFSLWSRCMESETEAFEEMIEYNIMDVDVLEQVYLKLRPYDRKHPNLALYMPQEKLEEGIVCGTCGGAHVLPTGQYTVTPVSKFEMYRCSDCGTPKRMRTNILSKEARANILNNIAE